MHTPQKLEEETLPGYSAADFYPIRFGEILHSKYQILGKLGYGANSTVWLSRDLQYMLSQRDLVLGLSQTNCSIDQIAMLLLKSTFVLAVKQMK